MIRRLWRRGIAWWTRRRDNRQRVYRMEVDDIERIALGFVVDEEFRRLKEETTLGAPGFHLLPPVSVSDHVLRTVLWILVSLLLLILVLAISFDIARALGYLPSTPLQ